MMHAATSAARSPTRHRDGEAQGRRTFPNHQRRALELLAGCGVEGCAEAVMLANGVTVEQMVELVRAGLATATPQRVKAGRERMEVAVLRTTDAGRKVPANG
jgi:hypothetical protein